MSAKRLFSILVVVLVLLGVGLFAGVYEANTMLTAKSHDLVTEKAAALAAAQQETQLGKARQDVQKYSDLNDIAKSVVPQDKDQVKTVSEIANLASDSGIARLSSVAFPPSTLGGGKTAKGLTQVTPVKGMPGVYALQITITQTPADSVSYSSFINFLSKLEQNRRTALVNSINVQPDPDHPDRVSFTLIINEYIKP
ncbi:MAG TPA: hypothetical protein VF466_00355 [Candidatus Saccharimonadales bacterium]